MKLEMVRCESDADWRLHPQGYYWHAITDDGGFDGSGNDPLGAVVEMTTAMEEYYEQRGGRAR